MVLPTRHNVALFTPFTGDSLFDAESMNECEGLSTEVSTKLPVWQAKHYLSSSETGKLSGMSPNDLVEIRGLETATLTQKMRYEPTAHTPKKEFSKRAIKKVSRKGGVARVVARGRTSLNSYSFSHRSHVPHLSDRLLSDIVLGMPSSKRDFNPLREAVDESVTGYDIDSTGLENWIEYGGLESAIKKHNQAVAIHEKWDEDIYYYGGLGPLEDFLRFGVLKLNNTAMHNAARIMTRTAYYNALGLLAVNDEAVKKIALNETASRSIREFRKSIKSKVELNISDVFSMSAYRTYKADYLWHEVRAQRNQARQVLREKHALLVNDPVRFVINQLGELFENHAGQFQQSILDEALSKVLLDMKINAFDGQNFSLKHQTNKGFISLFRAFFVDFQTMMQLFDGSVKRAINANLVHRKQVMDAGLAYAKKLDIIRAQMLSAALSGIKDGTGKSMMFYLIFSNTALREHAIEMIRNQLLVKNAANDGFKATFRLGDSVTAANHICF
jgi:hypothetical protein